MEPTPDTIKWPRTRDWTGNRPKGKSTTIMLLKEQTNKITPNDIAIPIDQSIIQPSSEILSPCGR